MIAGFLPFDIVALPPPSNSIAAVDITVCGHNEFTETPERLNSSAKPIVNIDIPYLVVV